MRISYHWLIYLIGIYYFQLQSQNLVQNYDFSSNTACPNAQAQLSYASSWQATLNSPDYFHTCGSGSYQIPNSNWGYQQTYNSGSAYAAFIVSPQITGHESIGQSLASPINAGDLVYFEYYVVRGENGQYAPYNFGMQFKFSSSVVYTDLYTDTLTDDTNWEKVSGTFTAPCDINEIEIGAISGISGVVMYDATASYKQSYVYLADVAVQILSSGGAASVVDTLSAQCSGFPITLQSSVSSATSYAWSSGETSSSIQVSSQGIYWVLAQASNGCSFIDSFVVQLNSSSFTVNLGNDTGLCRGASIVLDAGNTGAAYLWSTGSTSQTLTIKDTMYIPAGYFSVKVNQGSCTDEDTIFVAFYEKPDVGMKDTAYCQNEPLVLDATYSGATSYLWNSGETSASKNVTSQGQYSVIINHNGCLGYDTVNTYMIPVPVIDLGEDTIMCEGNNLTLDIGNAGTAYKWTGGETGTSMVVSSAGEYWVEVQNSYCYSSDTINVTYQTYPVVGLGDDRHICIYQQATLGTAYSGAKYSWSTGVNTQSIITDSMGMYWLIVDMNHCRDTDSIYLRVDPLPVFDLGEERSICPDEEIEISCQATADAYYWNTGINSQSILVKEPGLYNVTIVDSNSCVYSDSLYFNDYCHTVVYTPSAFSPNNDGKNDVFLPKGTNVYSFYMRIYDRWGKEIFFTDFHHFRIDFDGFNLDLRQVFFNQTLYCAAAESYS
jgi:hypothetical protein